MLHPVLLCGGSGSRLWPLSRGKYPKQFLPLAGEQTMLQATARRVVGLPERAGLIAVTQEDARFLVAEQLRQAEAGAADVVLEPLGRNTAPAVAVAAMLALARDPEAVLLVMPSDHLIQRTDAFQAAVAEGLPAAAGGRLVTFGVVPSHPETGYGYIRVEPPQTAVRPVAEFVEKPDAARAEQYLASGDYLWNSGMFLLGAQAYLQELGRLRPEMLAACERAFGGRRADLDFLRLDGEAFAACPSESIDYAVMEHTGLASVVALDCGWSDLGSWASLYEAAPADAEGNVLVGDVLVEGSSGCYLRSEGRLVAALGLTGQVVVETADAVLVASRDRVQDVKAVVERLKAMGRTESDFHRRVYRPWGSYEGIAAAERFQVKRIIVNPGQRLSLQMHHHRAEHWVVVRGTALVSRGDEQFLLSEDQSTYIPLGTTHRLENPGVIPLELIEVQSGAYLGEDDIVRYDDVYGRAGEKA